MQLSLATGFFDASLVFEDDLDVDVQMATVAVSVGWLVNRRWAVRASFGTVLDGELVIGPRESHDVEPGAVAALGVDYRAVMADAWVPFVDLSLTAGASWAATVAPSGDRRSYFSSDVRLGTRVGWNIGDKAFPYVLARLFGGPVRWDPDGTQLTGTDRYHVQLGLGATGMIGPIAVFAEWSGLGERAVTTGVGVTF